MCLDVDHADGEWSFFMADRKAAYKTPPLAPAGVQYCTVAVRSPKGYKWYGFVPRALLFGAVATVLHYNSFSRIIAVLSNMLFGLPVVNYFDDYGRLLPTAISANGIQVFSGLPTFYAVG